MICPLRQPLDSVKPGVGVGKKEEVEKNKSLKETHGHQANGTQHNIPQSCPHFNPWDLQMLPYKATETWQM